jgi:glycosidase
LETGDSRHRPRHDVEACGHCQRNRAATTPLDQPPGWLSDAVFYQIFPDRFARAGDAKPNGLEPWDSAPTVHGYKGGDLDGIVERLDWLAELGVNAIYLNPIFQSGANHRYHPHDYFRVDPLLGGDPAFERLLAACHARGMRVILDGVFNHSSRGFFQFHDVLENGTESPYSDWFHIHEWPLHPYSVDKPANYEAWWGLKALPKFNTDNPLVREFLMEVAEYWTRAGIDGWRLDVPEEVQTEGFWEEFRSRVRAINPDAYIVGEIWGDASFYIADGTRFDATMNYQFTAATIAFVVGRRLDHTTRLDNPLYTVAPALDAAAYRERMGRVVERYPQRVVHANLNLLDSHDTARILTIAGGDRDSVVLSLVLLLTTPGAPCLYYGTEIGLAGGKDPDNRRSFPWDRPASWDTTILESVRELIDLRAAHPALRTGSHRVLWPPDHADGSMIYAFERAAGEDRIVVMINAGDEAETETVPYDLLHATRGEHLWGAAEVTPGKNQLRVSLGPRRAAIYRLR